MAPGAGRAARDKLAAVCGYCRTGNEPSATAREEGDAFGNMPPLCRGRQSEP